MNTFAKRRSWGPTPRYDRVEAYEHPNKDFTVIAGPCSVESPEQIHQVAIQVAAHGATHLRGGVFRAGTYPGKNFGLVEDQLLKEYRNAAHANGLKNIIEVIDIREIPKLFDFADCFQVGCRQMQNYTLLRALGTAGKPVFLKRNPGATIDEWLGAAEHVLAGSDIQKLADGGLDQQEIYLIERGSSGNATHVRWDLSISMIPAVQALTDIPILVDGSHGTGRRDLVAPMTLAGVAAGADGCLVEVHPDPEKSLSDADQALDFESFNQLMAKVKGVRECVA